MTQDLNILYDAASWGEREKVMALLEKLRREEPVKHHQMEGFPDLWHVTRHKDIFEIETNTDCFVAGPRAVLMPLEREDLLRQYTGGDPHLIRSLISIDKPEHPPLRLLTQAWFMPKNLARLQSAIEASARQAMVALESAGGVCDFATDVALEFPLRVIMAAMDIPAQDYPTMLRLTQELFSAEDPDLGGRSREEVTAGLLKTFFEFSAYFDQLTKDRQAKPGDDIASVIANAEIDGQPIGDRERLGYYIIVATAGHDTTSFSLSEAVCHLAQNPDLYAELRENPEEMAPKIVEEAIRIAAPVRHFLRTAQHDIEIGGTKIKKDDTLILWYPSGSRDESFFPEPNRFDPHRQAEKRHASFGHGPHLCLGMHLARQENAAFLVNFARRVKSLELAGEPKFSHSAFVGGIKSLPIRAELV